MWIPNRCVHLGSIYNKCLLENHMNILQKVMNSNVAIVTTAYDSTDSTATSTHEGSRPVTDCMRLTAVSVTTSIAVGAADVWKLETFALIVYSYSTATAWLTNISGIHFSRAIRPPLATNLPTFSQIHWQIQQRHMPIKLLSQLLVMPSPFLTSLFPTVSLYLIAVGIMTRVAVDTADVWKLETPKLSTAKARPLYK